MIDLHYWPTPNGKKVTILLEECGLPYKIVPCNIQRGDQFTPEFLKMNPNHRMPVMVDHDPKGAARRSRVRIGRDHDVHRREGRQILAAGPARQVRSHPVGHVADGQSGPETRRMRHFRRAGPEAGDLTYAIARFTDEANRLYGVLNNRLYKNKYCVATNTRSPT